MKEKRNEMKGSLLDFLGEKGKEWELNFATETQKDETIVTRGEGYS